MSHLPVFLICLIWNASGGWQTHTVKRWKMSETDALRREEPSAPPGGRGWTLNEDWAATILGLVLLILVITGVIPVGVVP